MAVLPVLTATDQKALEDAPIAETMHLILLIAIPQKQ